jgi:RNA polymerase sigma factor (sigma-70 family)
MATEERRPDDGETAVAYLEEVRQFLLWRTRLEAGRGRHLLADAWARFHAAYGPVLNAQVSRHRLRDTEVAEVLQNVWGTIVARVLEFRDPLTPALLQAWTRTVVRARVADLFRDRTRHPQQPLAAVVGTRHEPVSREADPAVDGKLPTLEERAQAVLAALHTQGLHRDARILELHYLKGLPTEEVARQVGWRPANVRQRLVRVRRKLRAEFKLDDFSSQGTDA